MSPAVATLTEIPRALRLADTARRTLPPGTSGLLRFADDPLGVLLTDAPATASALRDVVLGPILRCRPATRDALLSTLRCYLGSGGSVGTTALRLHVHRNTVLNRLHQVEELTGFNVTDPAASTLMLLALRAVDATDHAAPA